MYHHSPHSAQGALAIRRSGEIPDCQTEESWRTRVRPSAVCFYPDDGGCQQPSAQQSVSMDIWATAHTRHSRASFLWFRKYNQALKKSNRCKCLEADLWNQDLIFNAGIAGTFQQKVWVWKTCQISHRQTGNENVYISKWTCLLWFHQAGKHLRKCVSCVVSRQNYWSSRPLKHIPAVHVSQHPNPNRRMKKGNGPEG